MPIRILSDQLASQIAAGEVVERPASVVKELVENALDAGATTINVEVRKGGRDLIQVADDGSGIEAGEVETAFQRHATSKLQSASDLEAIGTLGFRGEALSAIAAVSQLTVVTRTADDGAGTRLVLEGGRKESRDTVGAPQGTVIAVENLFYNVPARRKFLKTITTEKRLIDEFVTRYAMAYPDARFRLVHDGRVTFQSSGSGNLRDVLVDVYGAEIARELLEIGDQRLENGDRGSEIGDRRLGSDDETETNLQSPANQSPIAISGYVGPPSLHRANRSQITLYVNGRWIKDNSLTYAVIQAYHTLLPTGRYPVAVVFVRMPYERVDVNVHPAKTEVRFRDNNAVFSAVQRAVRQTLIAGSPVRNVALGARTGDSGDAYPGWGGSPDDAASRRAFSNQTLPHARGNLQIQWPPAEADEATAPVSASEALFRGGKAGASEEQRLASGQRLPIMRVVGQVGGAYIIAEGPDGLFLIDQHAAHERILYEQFMAARQREEIASQGLVSSETVQLAPDQATLLEAHLELLAGLGFQVEPFGPNTFVVRAIPALLSKLDPAAALAAVVEDLEAGNDPLQDKVEAKIILRVCKTAAVKAGQTLSPPEMEAMIEQLERCQNPHTCPHGRPTLIHLSAAQLARQFGRM
ncbi:MAG TPA: DNA mismatch repair endonuclease MutL [Candidatus Sulfomarinibacteraceae bacterium]|nr:DNA mismatch repair endonuclease MutL [Candidatus Sulfomarinibacteraceae bacterium]